MVKWVANLGDGEGVALLVFQLLTLYQQLNSFPGQTHHAQTPSSCTTYVTSLPDRPGAVERVLVPGPQVRYTLGVSQGPGEAGLTAHRLDFLTRPAC